MTNMLFRRAQNTDLDVIHELALKCGVGLTSLPKDIGLLNHRLAWSSDSFEAIHEQPYNSYYLFVLEDTEHKRIVGTSAIQSSISKDNPLYSFKLSKLNQQSDDLNVCNTVNVLRFVTNNHRYSELCTLFLDPAYRHSTNGVQLSRSRFLFMATLPERFQASLVAEMRGISNLEGQSPFWDAVGSHFFHMSYSEADRLRITSNQKFIHDLMPKIPIIIDLLPKSAQEVIGKTHQSTQPALNMLLREGFEFTNYIDIFDAGPTIKVARNKIKTIKRSQVLTVKAIVDEIDSKPYIITNTLIDFRGLISKISIDDNTCSILKTAAELLQIKCGDRIRCVKLENK
mgnify:CR=1 FL=1